VSVREYREIEAGEQVPSWETWGPDLIERLDRIERRLDEP